MSEAESAAALNVEVIYALPDQPPFWARLSLPEGSTVDAALQASGVLQKYPDIDLAKNKIGVFAKLVKLDTPLRNRDRVEIYRPLLADPKEVRKRRAAEGKVMKAGV